jgi:hypothetical protein
MDGRRGSLIVVFGFVSLCACCDNHFSIEDEQLSGYDASATASGIRLTLDGNVYGWPSGVHHPCDQFAAVGPNGIVRGIGTNVTQGWNIGILGTVGERIFFKYYEHATGMVRTSEYTFIMQDDALISTYSSPLVVNFASSHNPCAFGCSHYKITTNMGDFVFAVPSDRTCYEDNGICRIDQQANVYECYRDSEAQTACFEPYPPPMPRPPPQPPPSPKPPSPHSPPPLPRFPPGIPESMPQAPPPPPHQPPPPASDPHAPPSPPPPPPPAPQPPPASEGGDGVPVAVVVGSVAFGLVGVGGLATYFGHTIAKTVVGYSSASAAKLPTASETDKAELLESAGEESQS